ncbi:MAG: hypothetical protein AAGA62_10950, partial [Bacteroidota bacterium]
MRAIILCCLFLFIVACGQESEQSVDSSPKSVKDVRLDTLDERLLAIKEVTTIPGFGVGVVKNDQTVFAK